MGLQDWSYGSPVTGLPDQVRFLIGDIDECDTQLTDSEIGWLLSQSGQNPYRAAISGCRRLASLYARKITTAGGGISKSFSDLSKHYADLACSLRTEMAQNSAPLPYVGGISRSQKVAFQQNPDLVPPSFTIDEMDDPGTLIDPSSMNVELSP